MLKKLEEYLFKEILGYKFKIYIFFDKVKSKKIYYLRMINEFKSKSFLLRCSDDWFIKDTITYLMLIEFEEKLLQKINSLKLNNKVWLETGIASMDVLVLNNANQNIKHIKRFADIDFNKDLEQLFEALNNYIETLK